MSHFGGHFSGSVFGGGADVETMSSKDIEGAFKDVDGKNSEFLRKLAGVVNKMFNASIKTDGDPSAIAAQIAATLPDGVTRTLNGNDDVQVKALKSLANGVSAALGKPGLINTSAHPRQILTDFLNLVMAISNGINLSSVKMFEAINSLIRRMRVLQSTQKTLEHSLRDQFAIATDDETQRETQRKMISDVLPAINNSLLATINALEEQMVAQSSEHLSKLVRTNAEVVDFVEAVKASEDISQDPGVKESINQAMNTLSLTAVASANLEILLKTIKLPVADFAKLLSQATSGSGLAAQLADTVKGNVNLVSMLSDWQHAIDNIFDYSKVNKGADMRMQLAKIADDKEFQFKGGATTETAFERRVRMRNKARLMIARGFVKDLSNKFLEILKHVNFMRDLGHTVPVTEALRNLAQCLNALKDFRQSSIYPALIGLNSSAQGRQQKAEYIRSIDNLRESAGRVGSMQEYSAIRPSLELMRGAIDGLKEFVSTYSERLNTSDSAFKQSSAPAQSVAGGSYTLGEDTTQMFNQLAEFVTINTHEARKVTEAISEFKYYIEMANVEMGFKSASKSLEAGGERYERLLAEKIAGLIDNEVKSHNNQLTIIKRVQDKATSMTNSTNRKLLEDFAKHLDSVSKFVAHSQKTRLEFLQLVEAVEHHLRQFVIDISKNPRAISDLKEMLENTEFNSDWYGEQSGDKLAEAVDLLDKSMTVSYVDLSKNGTVMRLLEDFETILPDTYKDSDENKLLGALMIAVGALDPQVFSAAAPGDSIVNPIDGTIKKRPPDYPDMAKSKTFITNISNIPVDDVVLATSETQRGLSETARAGRTIVPIHENLHLHYTTHPLDRWNFLLGGTLKDLVRTAGGGAAVAARAGFIGAYDAAIPLVSVAEQVANPLAAYFDAFKKWYIVDKSNRSRVLLSVTQILNDTTGPGFKGNDGATKRIIPDEAKRLTNFIIGDFDNISVKQVGLDILTGNGAGVSMNASATNFADAINGAAYGANTVQIGSIQRVADRKASLAGWISRLKSVMPNHQNIAQSLGVANADVITYLKEKGGGTPQSLRARLTMIMQADNAEIVYDNTVDGIAVSTYATRGMVEELLRFYMYKHGGDPLLSIGTLVQSIANLAGNVGPDVKSNNPIHDQFLARVFFLQQHLSTAVARYIPSLFYVYNTLTTAKTIFEISKITYLCASTDFNQAGTIDDCGIFTKANGLLANLPILAGALGEASAADIKASTVARLEFNAEQSSGIGRLAINMILHISGASLDSRDDVISYPDTTLAVRSNSSRVIQQLSNYSVFGFPKGTDFFSASFAETARILLRNPVVKVKNIDYTETYRQLLASYRSNAVLRNLIEAVVSVSTQYGSSKEIKGGAMMMSPAQLYQRLMNYLVMINVKFDIFKRDMPSEGVLGSVDAWTDGKIENIIDSITSDASLKTAIVAFDVEQNTFETGKLDPLAKHFVRVIKGMVMKVFATVGVYDMFNNPVGNTRFTPMRMMIGGSNRGGALESAQPIPEIHTELVEVYFRMTLLAELQREIFAFETGSYDTDNNRGSIKERIVLIPEIDGVYSEFIDFIFKREQLGENLPYTEEDVKTIIRMVNDIYSKRKSAIGSNVTMGLLQDYINEVNRRYGIASANDKEVFRQESISTNRFLTNAQENIDNWGVSTFDTTDTDGYVAPSSAYATTNPDSSNLNKYKLDRRNIDNDIPVALHNFRLWLGQYFTQADTMSRDVESYSSIMDSVRNEFAATRNPQEKLSIVMRLLQGSDYLTTLSQVKYVMFHETVVTNLAVLNAEYSMIEYFTNAIKDMDVQACEKQVKDLLSGTSTNLSASLSGLSKYISNRHGLINSRLSDDGSVVTLTAPNTPDALDLQHSRAANGGLWGLSAILYTGPNGEPTEGGFPLSENARDLFTYFAVDRGLILRDLLAVMSDISSGSNGMIVAESAGGTPVMSFGRYIDHLKSLMASTRTYLELFGRIFSDSDVNGKIIGDFENVNVKGSYYWLERHFIEPFVEGVTFDSNNIATGIDHKYSLKGINGQIAGIYEACLAPVPGSVKFSIAKKSVLAIYSKEGPSLELVASTIKGKTKEDIHNPSAIVHHDIAGAFSELITFANAPANYRLQTLRNYNYVAFGAIDNNAGNGTLNIQPITNYSDNHNIHFDDRVSSTMLRGIPRSNNFNVMYYPGKGHATTYNKQNTANSVVMIFNDLLAKLIMSSYDYSGYKFPPTVVNGLANTGFNSGGTGRLTAPDVLPNPYQYLLFAISEIYTSSANKAQAVQDLSRMGIRSFVVDGKDNKFERLDISAVKPENLSKLIGGTIDYSNLYQGKGFKNTLNTPRWLLYNYVFAHGLQFDKDGTTGREAVNANITVSVKAFNTALTTATKIMGINLLDGEQSFMTKLFNHITSTYFSADKLKENHGYKEFIAMAINYYAYEIIQSDAILKPDLVRPFDSENIGVGGTGPVNRPFIHCDQSITAYKAFSSSTTNAITNGHAAAGAGIPIVLGTSGTNHGLYASGITFGWAGGLKDTGTAAPASAAGTNTVNPDDIGTVEQAIMQALNSPYRNINQGASSDYKAAGTPTAELNDGTLRSHIYDIDHKGYPMQTSNSHDIARYYARLIPRAYMLHIMGQFLPEMAANVYNRNSTDKDFGGLDFGNPSLPIDTPMQELYGLSHINNGFTLASEGEAKTSKFGTCGHLLTPSSLSIDDKSAVKLGDAVTSIYSSAGRTDARALMLTARDAAIPDTSGMNAAVAGAGVPGTTETFVDGIFYRFGRTLTPEQYIQWYNASKKASDNAIGDKDKAFYEAFDTEQMSKIFKSYFAAAGLGAGAGAAINGTNTEAAIIAISGSNEFERAGRAATIGDTGGARAAIIPADETISHPTQDILDTVNITGIKNIDSTADIGRMNVLFTGIITDYASVDIFKNKNATDNSGTGLYPAIRVNPATPCPAYDLLTTGLSAQIRSVNLIRACLRFLGGQPDLYKAYRTRLTTIATDIETARITGDNVTTCAKAAAYNAVKAEDAHTRTRASGLVLSVLPLVSHLFRPKDGSLDYSLWGREAKLPTATGYDIKADPFYIDAMDANDCSIKHIMDHEIGKSNTFASHVYIQSGRHTLARFLMFHMQICFDADIKTLKNGFERIQDFNNYSGLRTDQVTTLAGSNFRTMLAPPAHGAILLSSMSETVKAITTLKSYTDKNADTLKFRAETMGNISPPAQESININFPVLEKLFTALINKATFLKSVVTSDRVKNHLIMTRPLTNVGIGLVGPTMTPTFIAPGDSIKPHLESACETAIVTSHQALGIINDTLSEIVAKPEFFEVRTNFSQTYQQMNKRLPFTPLSQLTSGISHELYIIENSDSVFSFWPERGSEQASFQFKFGSRSLLTRYKLPFTTDKLQGPRDLVTRFNEASFIKLDDGLYNKATLITIDGLRLTTDFYAYANQQSASSCCNELYNLKKKHDIDGTYIDSNNALKDKPSQFVTYQMAQSNMQESNMLTTDSNHIASMTKISKHIVKSLDANRDPRQTMRIKNIVDANIVPFNLNALEREVPGIYLYNYAHAFDRTMLELLNVNPNHMHNILKTRTGLEDLDDTFDNYSPADIFATFLIHPYVNAGNNVYFGQLARIMRGDTGMDLGRPKMLSDQLFPKVLFYSMYNDDSNRDYAPGSQKFNGNMGDRSTLDRPRQLTRLVQIKDSKNDYDTELLNAPGQSLGAGLRRFNSLYIVRDTMFLVQIQRMLVYKLSKELMKHHNLVISSYSLLDSSVTEFSGNQAYRPDGYKMSPYDLSNQRNGLSYPKIARP